MGVHGTPLTLRFWVHFWRANFIKWGGCARNAAQRAPCLRGGSGVGRGKGGRAGLAEARPSGGGFRRMTERSEGIARPPALSEQGKAFVGVRGFWAVGGLRKRIGELKPRNQRRECPGLRLNPTFSRKSPARTAFNCQDNRAEGTLRRAQQGADARKGAVGFRAPAPAPR